MFSSVLTQARFVFFQMSQVFVSKEARGQGLGYELIKQSMILGGDCGFRILRVDATSHYT